jgi:GNAT superfamily N-acetyltransferase
MTPSGTSSPSGLNHINIHLARRSDIPRLSMMLQRFSDEDKRFFHPTLIVTSKTVLSWFILQILLLLNVSPRLRKILKLAVPRFARILVVLSDNRNLPLGVAFLNFVRRIGDQSFEAELGIGLAREIRGKGYGAAAMRYLLDRGRAEGITRVTLSVIEDNVNAIQLYYSFGFKQFAKETDFWNNKRYISIRMRLDLTK